MGKQSARRRSRRPQTPGGGGANFYQAVFELSPDGILLIEPETQRTILFNDTACQQLGYARGEFAQLTIADYEASESADEVRAHVDAVLRHGHAEFDTLQRTKQGELRHVRVWARTIELTGRPVLYVIFREITDQLRSQQAVRDSETKFRTLFEAAQDAIFVMNADVFLDCNKGTEELFGRPKHHIIGRSPLDLSPRVQPDGRPSADSAAEHIAIAMAGTPQFFSWVHLRGDGTPFDTEVSLNRIDAGGETLLQATVRDITDRARAERSQRLQSAALNAAGEAIVITDRRGFVEWVNPAFTDLTGYTLDEAAGRKPGDLIGSGTHTPEFFRDFWATIAGGRTWRGEMTNRAKDGRLYTESQSVTPIRDRSGAITHFVAIKEDITERLRLEAQFRQAQKMESVGHLASGVAHDFNNLLTVINGLTELMLEQIHGDDQLRKDVDEIHRAGERAATLTRQLLAFSRQQILMPKIVNLNTIVEGIESLLTRLLGEDIDVEAVMMPDLAAVKADPGQIEQVITNLAVNARDAMPQGGRLRIATGNLAVEGERDTPFEPTMPPGRYVWLSVSDTGTGMDEATRARIFEPFFTTKGPGKGTGLGLSTVYGIVKQSNGFVWASSEVGRGTTFTIYLPRVDDGVSAPRRAAAWAQTGTETVLVVEDNGALRMLATRFLERAGYSVIAAAGAAEAIELLQHETAPVHLLLTDVVMPGRSGRELADEIARLRPEIKVLYMSGYTSDTVVTHGVLESTVAFISKPFSAPALLTKVREVLDSPSVVREDRR